ncbi:Lipoteichoic acid synthase 1 [Clostridium tertium]|uniref:Lipoteichoic acid synthase 1 n=1 Tax=Clostridium tertium TaxID=1559 RepID=A0A6N3BG55_9CLOT
MLNYDEEIVIKENLPLRIKKKFIEGVKNKDFLTTLGMLLIKTLVFILLISDDKANGVNLKQAFYSMPPILVWITVNSAFLSLGFFFNEKVQKWAFWTLNLLFTFIIIGDMWYFRSNAVFLNYHMFKMTSNLDNLGSSIISMFRMVDILFIIDLVIIAFRNIKCRKSTINYKRNIVGGLSILLVSLIYLGYARVKIDIKKISFANQFVFVNSWAPNQTMSNLSPIGYHIFDAYNFYEQSKPYVFEGEELENVKKTLSSLKENNSDNEYSGIMKGKNLLLIQWESLETFIVNQKIDGQEITPNLNKLLSNSLYFNNFYEQTYNGTSSDAELITNTSVFPVREGSTFFRYPNNTYDHSFPNIFEKMGYDTLASHPDKGSYWNWLTNLKSIGYNTTLDSTDYDTTDKINLGVSDKSYLKQFGDNLKEIKEPYLAYTVTLTSHSPFDIPDEEKALKLPSNIEGTRLGGYFHSIHYTDKYLGELINSLSENGTLDNTVVVIYGDHEGVHKFYDDEVASIKGLEPWMEENNRKIPLIIYNKDLEGKTFSIYGGQVDTLPTLAYLFGAPKEDYSNSLTLGRNLLNTNKDYVILSNRELLHNGLTEEEQKNVESLIDISDKMIRGNYYRDEAGINE